MKRLTALILLAAVFLGLGGCIYDPAYYHRAGVVYDDSYATYSEPYYGHYAPGYYYDPWYYGWAFPYIGFSYYGSYGGHHHHYHSSAHTSPYHHH